MNCCTNFDACLLMFLSSDILMLKLLERNSCNFWLLIPCNLYPSTMAKFKLGCWRECEARRSLTTLSVNRRLRWPSTTRNPPVCNNSRSVRCFNYQERSPRSQPSRGGHGFCHRYRTDDLDEGIKDCFMKSLVWQRVWMILYTNCKQG